MIAQIEFFTRNYSAAEKLYSELQKKEPNGGQNFYGGLDYPSVLGRLRQIHGDKAAARRILEQSRTMGQRGSQPRSAAALYCFAAIESSLGHTESAFDHLHKAIASGWADARSPQLDPRFDGIAAEPRFRETIAALTRRLAELRRQIGQPIKMAAIGEKTSP